MRLDLFLKKTRLVRQRSLAKQLGDARAVSVNGKAAKPSQAVRAGDLIHLRLPRRILEVRVTAIPHGNVARRDVSSYIEILKDERIDRLTSVFEGDDTGEPDTV